MYLERFGSTDQNTRPSHQPPFFFVFFFVHAHFAACSMYITESLHIEDSTTKNATREITVAYGCLYSTEWNNSATATPIKTRRYARAHGMELGYFSVDGAGIESV